MKKVTIIGAGAFAVALSRVLDRNGAQVVLFTELHDEQKMIEVERQNRRVLPGIALLDNTVASTDAGWSFHDADLVVLALPSHIVRSVAGRLAWALENRVVCVTTKGVEEGSGMLMHDVLADAVGGDRERICVLSGPNLALEVADFLPSIATAAGSRRCTEMLREFFENDRMKIEQTEDVTGTLICGAYKNIYAIGAGILIARKAGSNAVASLVTRGFDEMLGICEAMGGQRETMNLACGIGDLVTTCTGELSRNRQFGMMIGRGEKSVNTSTTTEGCAALAGALKIADNHGLELPIVRAIDAIINHGRAPDLLLDAICR